ncbi:DUF6183 family protein [Actinoplanes sp. M2I2]|uniref:DUF6183 family protein n=1 Tax=Actinoplanes sp. M2I2 TaxID=1734444 RepID=UPI0020218410|nr:DUF6183 family protein [Actinoplanes sp. M2I2]
MTGILFPDGASNDVRHGLFEPTARYSGGDWAGDVLEPWLAAHQPLLRALHRAGRWEAAATVLGNEDRWTLYALSRVAELLILPYQPPAAGPDYEEDTLPIGAYEQFIHAIGGTFPRTGSFHPFLHELVAVHPDDDPDAPPALAALWWPGCMIGSLMLQRAGVTVRAGSHHLTAAVAAGSTLYWAWWRRHRPVSDLSHGWGSNSQWRTGFRRDYWLPDRLAYNVDAALEPSEQHPGGAPFNTDISLLRHRCSTMTDWGDDEWVWPHHYSEPAPFNLADVPLATGYLTELATIITDLGELRGIWDLAASRMTAGEPIFVADLAIALRHQHGTSMPPPWQYTSVFDHLLRLLCMTAGASSVDQAVRVVTAGDLPQRRYAAQLLTAYQPITALTSLFTGPIPAAAQTEELRALVLHELILRAVKVEDVPAIAEWATSPQRPGQPSDRLPRTLTALEGRPALPHFQLRSTSYPTSGSNSAGVIVDRLPGAQIPPSRETTTPVTMAAISTAVAAWTQWSNGHYEARTFEFTGELTDGALADTLAALGLHCLGTTPAADLLIRETSPGEAWQALFNAAANGGAYTRGEGGAQGRISAWRSLAALTSATEQADTAEVEELASRCRWYTLDPTTGWFDQTGWDLAVIAVSPDHRHLAVLAATDAD